MIDLLWLDPYCSSVVPCNCQCSVRFSYPHPNHRADFTAALLAVGGGLEGTLHSLNQFSQMKIFCQGEISHANCSTMLKIKTPLTATVFSIRGSFVKVFEE
jgi:hypothetical protein